MEQSIILELKNQFNLSENQLNQTIGLFESGATIPFIARYRKEATEGLDEVVLANLKQAWQKLLDFEKRKAYVLETIEKSNNLTEELRTKINNTYNLNELEDLFLPFKPGRKTRADVAIEKGLEPLAGIIMQQNNIDLNLTANRFLSNKVETIDEALKGASDIIAEWINERPSVRNSLRNLFSKESEIIVKVKKNKETEGEKYRDYFKFSEKIQRIPSHRILAIYRGETEGFLSVSILPVEQNAIDRIEKLVIKSTFQPAEFVKKTIKDAYKRLLQPSLETEFRNELKSKADDASIAIFSENLKQLLLAPPLGQKRILGIDPGFRTGCKVVCLDQNGNLLHNETIYPHPPQNEVGKAASKINQLVQAYQIDAIAIGNGTAGRETEEFIRYKVKFSTDVEAYVVNEAGASVYSASSVARAEFPQFDVTVRGAVSIGRRLMDPLAELVKIDPKAIGIGQYQHDVDQTKLKAALDQTIEFCVNAVGVNLNTASKHLLQYVSGIGHKLAENIVNYRTENGNFDDRETLKNVSGLGAKAYEQSSGFLRIPNGKNPLDNSSVHPESYALVEKMAKDLNVTLTELIGNKVLVEQINFEQYVSKSIGLPTLSDIKKELVKPGRDPRGKAKMFMFDKNIKTIHHLKEGQILDGIVNNITKFGAFIDLGIKQYGLVHISNLANKFVSDPMEIVKLGQQVKVKVTEIDIPRNRIQLSMKDLD